MPFVRFYDSPSTYIWEDEVGDVRHVWQGEDGEQGDPLMGQHLALVAVQASLLEGERLFAFLDDIYIVCAPSRVGEVYLLLQKAFVGADRHVQVHQGKTKIWNAGGLKPPVADVLTARARCEPPRGRGVERRSHVGRLKTRFERLWCSSWPSAVRCGTVAPEGTRTGPLVRANSACRRRANCMAVVDILRGNASQLLVEDCPSRIDHRIRKGP